MGGMLKPHFRITSVQCSVHLFHPTIPCFWGGDKKRDTKAGRWNMTFDPSKLRRPLLFLLLSDRKIKQQKHERRAVCGE